MFWILRDQKSRRKLEIPWLACCGFPLVYYLHWQKVARERYNKSKCNTLLSVRPFIGTEEEFLGAIVILPTETYEQGVWSAFSTNSGGILCSLIVLFMSLRNVSLHSSNSPQGTGGRVVVPALREKPRRR